MADLDLLLRWMSLRGEGSWSTFKDACEWLRRRSPGVRKPTEAMRALQALGHAEIDWDAGRWVVAPSVLVLLPDAGIVACLAGSRTPAVEERLAELEDGDLDVIVERHVQAEAPSAVFLGAADRDDLAAAAKAIGAAFVIDVQWELARAIAPLAVDASGVRHQVLPGACEWFDVDALRWRRDDPPSSGLRRYDDHGPYRCYWSDGRGWTGVDMDEGRYLALHRAGRHVIRYLPEPPNGTLEVPLATPLPRPHARTATLCTGLAPSAIDGHARYENVPARIARTIAAGLGQDFTLAARQRGR